MQKGKDNKKKCPACRQGHFTAAFAIQGAQEVGGARLAFSKLTGLAGQKVTQKLKLHSVLSIVFWKMTLTNMTPRM